MASCFVIQPFDNGKFDKRFEDIFKPAIEAAGLEAYRVDKDPGVSVPIEAIEAGIKSASVCLADITTDNPNVWYELGFAFASGRPVVMVCSEERTEKKYPFDIQHRAIISYHTDAPSDFDKLKEKLTARLKVLKEKGESLRNIAASNPTPSDEDLSQSELLVLEVIAGSCYLPNSPIPIYSVKSNAESEGLTSLGFNLAVRRLASKKLIKIDQFWNEHINEPYDEVCLTELAWAWIEANETRFTLHRQHYQNDTPF